MKISLLHKNIFSGYFAFFLLGFLSLMMMPIYLRLLGSAEWWVVAICITVQSFLNIFDAGLSQIMPRDVAKVGLELKLRTEKLKQFWMAYALIGSIVFCVCQSFIPVLVSGWLNVPKEYETEAVWVLRIGVVQFWFQFVNGAHVGFFYGVDQQKNLNIRSCIFAIAKHFFTFLVLMYSPKSIVYMLSLTVFSIAEYAYNSFLLKEYRVCKMVISDWIAALRVLFSELSILSLSAVIGMLVSQLDKLILSRMVSVEVYGLYVIVANFGLAFMQLQYPVVKTFIPRMSNYGMASKGDAQNLLLWLSALCVLPCFVAMIMSDFILKTWLHDRVLDVGVLLSFKLIIASVVVNALYHVRYVEIITSGHSRYVFIINSIVLLLSLPISSVLISHYLVFGAGASWLLISIIQYFCGLLFVCRLRENYSD